MLIDFKNLNNFGYGFFVGELFLFVFLGSLDYWLYKKIYQKDKV